MTLEMQPPSLLTNVRYPLQLLLNAVHFILSAAVCRYYSAQSWQHCSGPCHHVATMDHCL